MIHKIMMPVRLLLVGTAITADLVGLRGVCLWLLAQANRRVFLR